MSSSSGAAAVYTPEGLLKVGLNLHKSPVSDPDDMPVQSWCHVDGTTFETRIGPDYSHHKRKAQSKPCIYECAAVDLYETDSKISHVGRFLSLPGDHLDDSGNAGYLPQTFIVNFQIPNYALENALWGTCAGDGPGYSIIFYFVLSAYGREQVAKRGKLESAADEESSFYHGSLASGATTPRRRPAESSSAVSSLTSMFSLSSVSSNSASAASAQNNSKSSNAHLAPPSASSSSNCHYYYSHTDPACFRARDEPCNAAVRLLHNFVESEEKGELRQRFKAICRMMNVDKVGLGGAIKKLVSSYNATPFLIRTCSVFWRSEKPARYFEVDVDVHRFSYTARLGLRGVQERIKDVVFDFGFVIEGHSDFELPENMLGAVRISKLDLSLAKKFPKQ